jgi:hypothetical protein
LNLQKFFGSFFQKRTALLFEKRSKNFCQLFRVRSAPDVASAAVPYRFKGDAGYAGFDLLVQV